eukprot:11611722-Alexandrium_andersonii.AAC.1
MQFPRVEVRPPPHRHTLLKACKTVFVVGLVLLKGYLGHPGQLKATTGHLQAAQLVAELMTEPA